MWNEQQNDNPLIFGCEVLMSSDVYQGAYDAANAELTEIVALFEQLQRRKQLVETAVDALKPFCSVSDEPMDRVLPRGNPPAEPFPQAPEPAPFPFPVEAAPELSPAQSLHTDELNSDALQSRINRALGGWGMNSASFSPAV
jgi:hypothetical protein